MGRNGGPFTIEKLQIFCLRATLTLLAGQISNVRPGRQEDSESPDLPQIGYSIRTQRLILR